MNMSSLVDLAGTGATWVLYFLLALSVIQMALIVERAIVFYGTRAPKGLHDNVRRALATGSTAALTMSVTNAHSLEARVLATGVASAERGADATHELMHSTMAQERMRLER